MNCVGTNWNAIAAIGTCAGALASFLTILFAVLSNKKSNKLMNNQISAMMKQLEYLSNQNYIAQSALEESKKQTELAKKEFDTSFAELMKNRYNSPEIKIKSMDKLNENIELQNRLIGLICKHYQCIDKKEDMEENNNAD